MILINSDTGEKLYDKGKDNNEFFIKPVAWNFLKANGLILRAGKRRKDIQYTEVKTYLINSSQFRRVFIKFVETEEGQEFLKGDADYESYLELLIEDEVDF